VQIVANEITIQIGVDVTNGLDKATPIPFQTILLDQATPGVGGAGWSVPVGSAPTVTFQIQNYSPTPGMVFMQNVSPNGAVVSIYSNAFAAPFLLGYMKPGQISILPGGSGGEYYGLGTDGNVGTVQVFVINF
jgi:hypothetical protein